MVYLEPHCFLLCYCWKTKFSGFLATTALLLWDVHHRGRLHPDRQPRHILGVHGALCVDWHADRGSHMVNQRNQDSRGTTRRPTKAYSQLRKIAFLPQPSNPTRGAQAALKHVHVTPKRRTILASPSREGFWSSLAVFGGSLQCMALKAEQIYYPHHLCNKWACMCKKRGSDDLLMGS